MCNPVIAKNVAPNRGDGKVPSGAVNFVTHSAGSEKGRRPSSIRCFHSIKCKTRNATPKRIVSSSHFLTAFRSLRAEAETPITIVRLDDSRQSVMIIEKMMLGLKGKGVGQTFE